MPPPATPTSPLWDLLPRQRRIEVVDIGANPVNGAPPYQALLDDGMAAVTGFEPEEKAFAALAPLQGGGRRYLPYAVGDGQPHTLYVCWGDGMSSLLEPDPAHLGLFNLFPDFGRVVDTVPVQTRRLDDIDEVEHADLLKIDIQGGELDVFRGGRGTLTGTVAIHTEVSFMTLYKDQPSFGEVDVELRAQGFVPHHFAEVKRWAITPTILNNDPRVPLNQLLEADIVYVRDISRADELTDEQLVHTALIAQHCYGSVDLVLRCILELTRRGSMPAGADQEYIALLSHGH